jgi:hypothetical protein
VAGETRDGSGEIRQAYERLTNILIGKKAFLQQLGQAEPIRTAHRDMTAVPGQLAPGVTAGSAGDDLARAYGGSDSW